MGHLRLLLSPPPFASLDEACLQAFQGELDYIVRTLRRLGTPPSEVDDLVQEVFLALRSAWPQYDSSRPLRPYLFGISFRLVSAHMRKYRREVAREVPDLVDEGGWPDEAVAVRQSRALLLTALDKIPLLRRGVLVMHDLDETPVAAIAAVLGIPLFTVYSRLRKARTELRAALRRLSTERAGGWRLGWGEGEG